MLSPQLWLLYFLFLLKFCQFLLHLFLGLCCYEHIHCNYIFLMYWPFYHYEMLPTKSSLVIFFVLRSISPHINVAPLTLLSLLYACIFSPSFYPHLFVSLNFTYFFCKQGVRSWCLGFFFNPFTSAFEWSVQLTHI